MLTSRSTTEGLIRLTRLAQLRGDEHWLDRKLSADLIALVDKAFEVAQQTGDPLGWVLARHVEAVDDVELVGRLAERIDGSTDSQAVSLRELALVVVTLSIEARVARWPSPTPEQRLVLAELRLTRGLRLEQAGHLEEGLECTSEVVAELRRLAANEDQRIVRSLARGLHNLSIQLGALDRHGEAVELAAEATERLEKLSEASRSSLDGDLADALANLGIELQHAGRRAEGLEILRRAHELSENANAIDPLERARLQMNLGLAYTYCGRSEEAVSTMQEAVERLQREYAVRPLVAAPDLATGWTNLGKLLALVGRTADALRASGRAVEIRRKLARSRPEAFEPMLARSLINLAMDCAQFDELDDAMAFSDEAATLLRKHVGTSPEVRYNLVKALTNRLQCAIFSGDAEAPQEIFHEAAASLADIAAEGYASRRVQGRLGIGWLNLGNTAIEAGWSHLAIEPLERARGLLTDYTEQQSGLEGELAQCLASYTSALDASGREREALAAARDTVAHYRRLAERRPEEFSTDLAIALANLGLLADAAGLADEALAASTEAVEVQRSVADNTESLGDPNLPGMLAILGVRLARADRLEEAVAVTREALARQRSLVAQQADLFSEDLERSLINLAAMLRKLGRDSEADDLDRELRERGG